MGIPEKSAFVVLVLVVASIVTCGLFVCREVPEIKNSLRPVTDGPALPAVVPAVIVEEDGGGTALAAPALSQEGDVPDTRRWYRRKGLAPRWMMRTRETRLEQARGAHVRRADAPPELRVDLVKDSLKRHVGE